ncbi:hypothetical protein [Streptomyces sp. NPDC003006]
MSSVTPEVESHDVLADQLIVLAHSLTTRKDAHPYVQMPDRAEYLLPAFSVPVSGTESPMGGLCEAIAHSLRWVHPAEKGNA